MPNEIIASFEEVRDENAALAPTPAANPMAYFSTFEPETMEEAINLAAALSDAEALEDQIGNVIGIHDYVVQPIEVVNEKTGVIESANRIVLMCDEGNFACVSSGVETSMRNLTTALKNFPAPWNPSVKVKPVKKQGKNGFKFTSLEFVR